MIDDERERSEELKRAGVDVIVRIRMDDLQDLEGLKQRLEGGWPYVICQVRLMRGCVVSCRGLGACAGVVSVRGGVVVVVWVPPGW